MLSAPYIAPIGKKKYELKNHLGNVMATISDRKLYVTDHWQADVVSSSDYYPFGMTMPSRSVSSDGYRFGFQGQERDDEVYGAGNYINFAYRGYNPRIGRFFAIDPLAAKFPWNSSYAFSENRVTSSIELEGLEAVDVNSGQTGPYTNEQVSEGTAYESGTYEVQAGEGLYTIANKNNISVDQLMAANNMKDINQVIHPGQELKVDSRELAMQRQGNQGGSASTPIATSSSEDVPAVSGGNGTISESNETQQMKQATGDGGQNMLIASAGGLMAQAGNQFYNPKTQSWLGTKSWKTYTNPNFKGSSVTGYKFTSMKISGSLKVGGVVLGVVNAKLLYDSYRVDQISHYTFYTDQAVNAYSVLGGAAGVGFGIGWEAGRVLSNTGPWKSFKRGVRSSVR